MIKDARFISTPDGLNLWIETFGDPRNEACIFISGAGANASFWSERLCSTLAGKAFYVIRYDHRDIGYSDKVDFEKNPYDVGQLAKDVLHILDSLFVPRAHVIGHSMGGFIVQLLAIHHPERLISISSLSSSTNSPLVPEPLEETWKIFMENHPEGDFEADLAGCMPVWKYLNGSAAFDEDLGVQYTKNLYHRQDVVGALGASHVKAQVGISDRSELLKEVKIPALIIHGEEDYLVDKYGGIQTAACIENSELVLIPKMGHLPFNHEILLRFENEMIQFLTRIA